MAEVSILSSLCLRFGFIRRVALSVLLAQSPLALLHLIPRVAISLFYLHSCHFSSARLHGLDSVTLANIILLGGP